MDPRDFYAYIPLANEPGIRKREEERQMQMARRDLYMQLLRVGLHAGSSCVIGATLGFTITHQPIGLFNVVLLIMSTMYLVLDRILGGMDI